MTAAPTPLSTATIRRRQRGATASPSAVAARLPEQSLRYSEQNLVILRSLVNHPYSIAFGLALAAVGAIPDDAPMTRALGQRR